MAAPSLPFLDTRVGIVDSQGRPTPQFIRWFQDNFSKLITASNTANSACPKTRQINTGTGLQGGGDLSVDRTLSLVNPYVYITQAAYDALVAPDPSTYYYTPATGGAGSGTVTSFAFTNGGGISGTVINPTTAPTLALTLDANGIVLSKLAAATAASILGAPAAGNAAYLTPAQAKIVLAITALDVSGLASVATSGAFIDTTGTVGVARGGTGLTALALGDVLYSSAANTLSTLVGNAAATKKFLTQTGTGAASAAPAWSTIAAGDVPTLNQSTTGSAATLTTGRTIGMTGDVVWTSPSFDGSGNVTAAGTIQASAITLAKMANVATATVFYRKTAGTGAPEVQTLATLKTDLGLTGTNSGDQTITLTGDATGSGTGSFAVTVGKINGVSLAGLATGILKNTTATGAPSIAVAADFPTLNQNTTGSAATLTTSRNIDGQAFNGSADTTVIAPGTHAAASKATPVDADEIPLVDSAASNVLKKLTWANLKATLLATVMSWTARQTFSALTIGTFAVDGSWTAYTPAISSEIGVITSYTINTAYYKRIGNLVAIHVDVTITNAGSAALALFVGLPFTIGSGNTVGMVIRWGDKVLGGWDCGVGFASTGVRKYDGTTFIATGAQLVLSGIYECA